MNWIDGQAVNVPYYTFENIENTNTAKSGFTTRMYRVNGEQNDFFQPLLRVSSEPEKVAECTDMLVKQFGTDTDHLVQSAQKHTANIHLVVPEDLGPVEKRPVLEYVDGLITDIPGVMLQIFGADCPSVYLVDPVHKAIGLCHSGRKGTQKHIAAVMLGEMHKAFGTMPEDVQAAVSPGICVNCYEVGDDVAEDFRKDILLPPAAACSSAAYSDELYKEKAAGCISIINGRYHLDLFKAIRLSLETAGLPAGSIEVSPLCTRCRSDIFYSFRAQGCITSENSAVLMLRSHI